MPAQVPDEDPRRRLPSVDRLLVTEPLAAAGVAQGHALAVDAARAALASAREQAALGHPLPSEIELAEDAARRLAVTARGTLRPVINATGVILHTNLGRAPLSAAALQAMQEIRPAIAIWNSTWPPASAARAMSTSNTALPPDRRGGGARGEQQRRRAAPILIALAGGAR